MNIQPCLCISGIGSSTAGKELIRLTHHGRGRGFHLPGLASGGDAVARDQGAALESWAVDVLAR